MERLLKLACFVLVPVSLSACDSARTKAIKDGIANKETIKGNHLLSFDIDHEREHSGVTTVYYNAHCQAQGETDPSNTFNIADSIDVSKTGDGLYQAN